MAVGIAGSIAASLLDALLNSVAYDGPANLYVKLHIGDPGASGTSNAASNTTRQEVTFAVASSGTIANDNAPSWVSVPASEDYTHFSVWDHVSAGNFLFSGTMTADAVTSGNTFTVAVGDLDVALTNIAS